MLDKLAGLKRIFQPKDTPTIAINMRLAGILGKIQAEHEKSNSSWHKIQAESLISGDRVPRTIRHEGIVAAQERLLNAAAHLVLAARKIEEDYEGPANLNEDYPARTK